LVKPVEEGNALDAVSAIRNSRSGLLGFDEDLDEDVEELRGDGLPRGSADSTRPSWLFGSLKP
jgi:hypothetical protein